MGLGVFYTKLDSTVHLIGATDRFTVFNITIELSKFDTNFEGTVYFNTKTTNREVNLLGDASSLKELIALYNPPNRKGMISLADILDILPINNILLYSLAKKDEIPFLDTIYMILAPDSVIPVTVNEWINENYDYIRPDIYTFIAEYDLPEFRTNPTATVDVYFMFTINASSLGVLASNDEIKASYE
jgi:hypothetical protein